MEADPTVGSMNIQVKLPFSGDLLSLRDNFPTGQPGFEGARRMSMASKQPIDRGRVGADCRRPDTEDGDV
jgi:hypothetical protein